MRHELDETLGEKEAQGLLLPHEVVRDPVHGDIAITALERALIDTPPLQRLRGIHQLGPTHLVYPGAVHTRFLHSLGTLHVAEQLVQTVNNNCRVYSRAEEEGFVSIAPLPHLLIRLTALLHDAAHMPFGHTLEDEGNLGEAEWQDENRADALFGEDPRFSIAPPLREYLYGYGIGADTADRLATELRTYLTYDGDPYELPHPYIRDLVGNTLCADLLDYVERDSYFCGLRERSGDRVVKHLAVLRVEPVSKKGVRLGYFRPSTTPKARGRAVLLTYRFERDHGAGRRFKAVRKPEILSEAIDLLRRRFSLSQKVYFHRTKIAASAMLIEAAQDSGIPPREFYGLTDSEFLARLENDANPCCGRLISAYRARRLYQPVYRLDYKQESDEEWRSRRFWQKYEHDYRNPDWRTRQARWLEKMAGLPPGSCSIYCPDHAMNMKQFDMLVQNSPDGTIRPLKDTLDATRRMEMDAINRRFSDLWALEVFVDPDALDVTDMADERVQDLSALCEGVMEFENDIEELARTGRKADEQIAEMARQDLGREGRDISLEMVKQTLSKTREPDDHEISGDDLYERLLDGLRVAARD
jgi:uncharacterized protein